MKRELIKQCSTKKEATDLKEILENGYKAVGKSVIVNIEVKALVLHEVWVEESKV
jgi:hypothetical protein